MPTLNRLARFARNSFMAIGVKGTILGNHLDAAIFQELHELFLNLA